MKVFQYDFPDMLIKFSSERKYLEDLCSGKIYMNESGYFRKLEDTYRGDKYDGKYPISLEQYKGTSMKFGPLEIPIECVQNFTLGFAGDDKIPLYCCSQISEDILRKETEMKIKFRPEFIKEMSQFGSYYAVFSKNELLQNVNDFVKLNGLVCMNGIVSYVDIHSEYDLQILNGSRTDQYQSFFKKDLLYRWQNEWRMLIVSSNDDPLIDQSHNHYIANIKPLKWFYIGNVEDLCTNAIEIREVDDADLDENVLTR